MEASASLSADTSQTRSVPVPDTTVVAPMTEKPSPSPVMRRVTISEPSLSGDVTLVTRSDSATL